MSERFPPATLPSLLRLPAIPKSEDQILPYIRKLHSILVTNQAEISRVVEILGRHRVVFGTTAEQPTANGSGVLYIDITTGKVYYDDPTASPFAWTGIAYT